MDQRLDGWDISLDAPLKEDSDTERIEFMSTESESAEETVAKKEMKSLLNEKIAEFRKQMTERELEQITDYIIGIYDCKPIAEASIEVITGLTSQDKKNEGNIVKCSLLNNIGDCTFNINIDDEDIKASLAYFNNRVV